MSAPIQAKMVGRWYGQVVGLNELTVDIEAGITGLLGPNGAGKTTFLRLVAGELKPSRGTLSVLGQNPFANRELFRRIGFCPQQDALYEDLSALEFVTFLTKLRGLGAREARERAKRALDRVGLADAMTRRLHGFSKGMRQRTRIAQSFAHEPELLILDEPLTGLDPLVRIKMLELFRELSEDGCHVVLSSHVLHEVSALTESVVLVHRGRLLARGAVPEIRKLLDKHPRRVEIHAREARRLAAELVRLEVVTSVKVSDEKQHVVVETNNVERFFQDLTPLAAQIQAGITELESADAGLEAVFDYLVK